MSERTSHGHGHRPFLPALGKLPVSYYDALGLVLGAPRMYRAIASAADHLGAGPLVLDVGSGSGALLRTVGRRRPDARLLGVDPDERMLAQARRKAARSRHAAVRAARWELGYAQELPVGDDSVDLVCSSLMFHHLDPESRPAMLAEVRRVLRPGGVFVLADFDGSRGGIPGPFLRDSPLLAFGPGEVRGLLEVGGFVVTGVRRVRLLLGGVEVLVAAVQ
jgi:ubiquinone/menaquinone biosynthesis C-methylase UbiE